MTIDEGAFLEFEMIPNAEVGTNEIAWKHIGHHLNSAKDGSHGRTQGRDEKGLGQARNAFEQDVTIRKESHHSTDDDRTLTHNDLLDFGHEFLNLLDLINQVQFSGGDFGFFAMSTASSMIISPLG